MWNTPHWSALSGDPNFWFTAREGGEVRRGFVTLIECNLLSENCFNNSGKKILRAVVEVVPVVAGADPVVIGGGVVGLVEGVRGGVVKLAGLGVLAGGLGVEGRSGLSVEGLEHLHTRKSQDTIS